MAHELSRVQPAEALRTVSWRRGRAADGKGRPRRRRRRRSAEKISGDGGGGGRGGGGGGGGRVVVGVLLQGVLVLLQDDLDLLELHDGCRLRWGGGRGEEVATLQ